MNPLPNLMRSIREKLWALKMNPKPVDKLTEEEKFAICVGAGVAVKSSCIRAGDSIRFIMETESKCGIVLDGDRYRVYVRELDKSL